MIPKNYQKSKSELSAMLNSEIGRYVKLAGGREGLSRKLGRTDSFVAMVLKRQSFSALERLWKECVVKVRGDVDGNR